MITDFPKNLFKNWKLLNWMVFEIPDFDFDIENMKFKMADQIRSSIFPKTLLKNLKLIFGKFLSWLIINKIILKRSFYFCISRNKFYKVKTLPIKRKL